MNEATKKAMAQLVVWYASSIKLTCCTHAGHPAAEIRGTTSTILHAPGAESVGIYAQDMEQEPEFKVAWSKVCEAVQGLHDAREAIIERKTQELATVVHGEQLNGIRALVDQIQGGAES